MNGNNKNHNLNKREFPWPVSHEPTNEEIEKYFEEKTGVPVSFHWENNQGEIVLKRSEAKKGVLTPIKKNMNDKKNIDWENWEKENQKEVEATKLKNTKSGSISYIKEIDELTKWEVFHAHWETYLIPHEYWKNWQEKIKSFKTEKEIHFYTDRLKAFMDFVRGHTRKDSSHVEEVWNPEKTPKLIEQELKRLEKINEEDFKKEDKFADVGLKELSIKEMLNDPWFSKQIDNIFGLEKESVPPQKCAFCAKTIDPLKWVCSNNKYFCDSDCMVGRKQEKDDNGSSNNDKEKKPDYQTWTQEQLITEINRLKTENEELKNNQSLTNSEKENRLQKNQEKLDELNTYYNVDSSQPNKSNNNFPTGWVVGGGILAVVGLVAVLIIRNKKRKKKIK